MIAEVHWLKKNIVNCPNDELSQPGTYADVLDEQVQMPNCDKASATSDNHNLKTKIDSIPEHESLNGKERFLSVFVLVTKIVSCLDTTAAHSLFKIKKKGPQSSENLDNKTANELEKSIFGNQKKSSRNCKT